MYCSSCGKEILVNNHFCKYCGAQVANNLNDKTIQKPKFPLKKLLIIGTVFIIILGILPGLVLAYSVKIKESGDREYKKQNYVASLDKYNTAKSYWFIEKISPQFRNKDLEAKIKNVNIMIKSENNYKLGVDAYVKNNYKEAEKYLSLLAENDQNIKEAQEIIQKIHKANEITPTPIPTKKPSNTTSIQADQPNYDLVLTQYRLDAQNGKSMQETLLTTVTNNPAQICPNIIAEKTSQQNIYYLVSNNIQTLKSKYSKYRNSVEYIDNNLNGLDGVLQMVKDKCASLGYLI